MKTILHRYTYDLRKPAEEKAYRALQAKLKKEIKAGTRGAFMRRCWSNPHLDYKALHKLRDGQEITLEPEHLFSNQWNADAGRVFDWYERHQPNAREGIVFPHRDGYWLDMTPEMIAIRENTLACGYTGEQYSVDLYADGRPWLNTSPRALGSPYLKESELHLLRLQRISDTGKRPPLTPEELAYLKPLYLAAQTEIREGARLKAMGDVHNEYRDRCELALMKRDGLLWMLGKRINTENVIFYDHTRLFSFGWQKPMNREAADAIREKMVGFPFAWEIKEEAST